MSDEMTPQEIAAMDQLIAGINSITAKLRVMIPMVEAIGEQAAVIEAKMRKRELAKLLSHPDVANLDAQFDGFYDPPSGGTQA